MPAHPSAATMILRALLRRCPNCGARGIFRNFTELREQCPNCGMRLHRGESDYFIGAYLLNLVVVEILFAILLGAVTIATYPDTPWTLLQWSGLVLIAGGAVVCYPMSKALWLAVDLILRPISPEELAWHHRGGVEGDEELPHL
jgi:uncharacterized protein (DUF983 family)